MAFSNIKKLAEIYCNATASPEKGDDISCRVLDISKADEVTCYTVKIGAPFNTTRKLFFLDEK
jgi:hypothetical protein